MGQQTIQTIGNELLFLHCCTWFVMVQVEKHGKQQELEVLHLVDQRHSGQGNNFYQQGEYILFEQKFGHPTPIVLSDENITYLYVLIEVYPKVRPNS